MVKRKVAVLGGGNGSFAGVVDAVEAGHEVTWWRRDKGSFGAVYDSRTLTVIDHDGQRSVAVNPTDNIGAAIQGAELILVPTPATAQADIAKALIYLPPGTFGSYLMMSEIRKAGCDAKIAIAETGTLPWLCRKQDEATVSISTRASRLPTGVFPRTMHDAALAVISDVFEGAIEPVEDALSGALMNAGPIIHPPLIFDECWSD